MKKIKSVTFTAGLIVEGSWGARDMGQHESTMDYYESDDRLRGCIEWGIPSLEETESIGLWFDEPALTDHKRVLTDYDGVHSLPKQAWELLESVGIVVDKEFK